MRLRHCGDLVALFRDCFDAEFNTRLIGGADEPLYKPSDDTQPYHAVFFVKDYYSSALHECAHWLIAGAARRCLIDYGYWYQPDGRTADQQASFFQAEVKPQALESLLAEAAGHRFDVSLDNLNGQGVAAEREAFRTAVAQQAQRYQQQGLPPRAQRFCDRLRCFYWDS